MSSTNRGAERREADFYPTVPWVTRAVYRWLLRYGYVTPRTSIVDPCAGDGAILRALRADGHMGYMRALELRTECAPQLMTIPQPMPGAMLALVGLDSLTSGECVLWPDEVTITNPPFGLAAPFVERWAAPATVAAMLLPTGFLGSAERAEWWPTVRPAHMLVLSERPAFVAVCKGIGKSKERAVVKGCGKSYPLGTKGVCACAGTIGAGTDSSTYAWFVWAKAPRPAAPAFDWLRRDATP